MILTRLKLGAALALALCVTAAGFVAHRSLFAQQPRYPSLPAQSSSPYRSGGGDELRIDGQNPYGPAPRHGRPLDADQRLADMEKRLEALLGDVRALRQELKKAAAGPSSFTLKYIKASRAAEVVQAAFPDRAIRLTTDDSTNSLFIQAADKELKEVRKLLEVLDAAKN